VELLEVREGGAACEDGDEVTVGEVRWRKHSRAVAPRGVCVLCFSLRGCSVCVLTRNPTCRLQQPRRSTLLQELLPGQAHFSLFLFLFLFLSIFSFHFIFSFFLI
jgi:hypothetical protein